MNLLNLVCLIYQGYSAPFNSRFKNRLELFNELTVVVCSLHMMTFTDWIPDYSTQYLMGWSMIIVIIINLIVNLFIIVVFSFKSLHTIAVKYYRLARHKLLPYELDQKLLKIKLLLSQKEFKQKHQALSTVLEEKVRIHNEKVEKRERE